MTGNRSSTADELNDLDLIILIQGSALERAFRDDFTIALDGDLARIDLQRLKQKRNRHSVGNFTCLPVDRELQTCLLSRSTPKDAF